MTIETAQPTWSELRAAGDGQILTMTAARVAHVDVTEVQLFAMRVAAELGGYITRSKAASLATIRSLVRKGYMSYVYRQSGLRKEIVGGELTVAGKKYLESLTKKRHPHH